MSKRARTLTALIPTYQRDRSEWRRHILTSVLSARDRSGVSYRSQEPLEVVVLLYLKKGKRHHIHDVDNRLKDVLDALQGRFGGPKSHRAAVRLIDNDNQVCRIVMEKQPIPKMFRDDAGGRLLIRPYRAHRWPLQASKGHHVLK
jgi:Holliday junction resolvase RusA-like endonuclease